MPASAGTSRRIAGWPLTARRGHAITLSESTATLFARLGFAARGLVYLLIGWFAVDAALRGGETADNKGAIASLADKPFGPALVLTIAAGLAGYALWRLAEAATNPERLDNDAKGLIKRGGMAFSGVAHVVLAWSAVQIALHPRSGGGASPNDAAARDWTGWLLEQPLGWVLVGLVAACFLFGTIQQARKAWKGDFIDELAGQLPSHVCTMGRIGYGARGIVFAILAGFFAVAAWQAKASKAGAMSDALEALQDQPGGKWLLIAVGIGLGLFGAYSFVEARYRRIRVALPG